MRQLIHRSIGGLQTNKWAFASIQRLLASSGVGEERKLQQFIIYTPSTYAKRLLNRALASELQQAALVCSMHRVYFIHSALRV